jgi:peptidyl-prolyl cis-trans isomerase SurA
MSALGLHSLCCIGLAAGLGLGLAGCKKTVPPNVAATVNGRAITFADLEKQYKRQFPNQPGEVSQDQVQFQKLELLRVMIDEEILLQRAEKLGLIATEAEVESKYNEIRAPYTQEEFQKQLDARQMTVDELKAQLRRDLSVEKLMNKELISQINITDKDVTDFYNANRAAFNYPENNYHVAQIVVTPVPDPGVRNLKQDKAQNEDQARKKIQMLEARIRQGEDFGALAQNFSEDPNSSANGGDMGYVPESALEKTDADTRKTILGLLPGQVSPPIKTPVGYRLLKMISREPAGQRELNDPRVQQNIRETLRNRKEQLLRNAYVDACRNEAQVVNYLAMSIAPGFQKK